jgi:hypothetical protein
LIHINISQNSLFRGLTRFLHTYFLKIEYLGVSKGSLFAARCKFVWVCFAPEVEVDPEISIASEVIKKNASALSYCSVNQILSSSRMPIRRNDEIKDN